MLVFVLYSCLIYSIDSFYIIDFYYDISLGIFPVSFRSSVFQSLYILVIHFYHWFIMISTNKMLKDYFPVSFSFFSRKPIFSWFIYIIDLLLSISLYGKWFPVISSFFSIFLIYSGDSFISLIYYEKFLSYWYHFLLVFLFSIWPYILYVFHLYHVYFFFFFII